jgi:enoyl-CoA hydratase/carnithine racemase
VEQREENIAFIQLNRPKALNALCDALFVELSAAIKEADSDPNTSAIVLTGSEKAFAAGADIKEMKDKEFTETYTTNMLGWWHEITKT